MWPGEIPHFIAGREFVVVAPPALAADRRIRAAADICEHVLRQHPAEPTGWVRWCAVNRVQHPNPMGGPKLDQVSSIVRAVIAGLGMALVPRCLVDDDIENGLVVCPFAESLTLDGGYFLTYPEAKRGLPALVTFRDWILSEVEPGRQGARQVARSRGNRGR